MKITEFFKKSKKAILIIEAAAMICFGFGGCGDKSNTAQDNTKSETTQTETQAKNDTSSAKENNSDTSKIVEYTTTDAKFKAPEGLKKNKYDEQNIFISDVTNHPESKYITFDVYDVGKKYLPLWFGSDGKVPKQKEDVDVQELGRGLEIIDFSYSEDDKSECVYVAAKFIDGNSKGGVRYQKYYVDKKDPSRFIGIAGDRLSDTGGDLESIIKSFDWK